MSNNTQTYQYTPSNTRAGPVDDDDIEFVESPTLSEEEIEAFGQYILYEYNHL